MVRVVIDLAVDAEPVDAAAIETHVGDFLAHLREHWPTVNVARADVTAPPDPDQATDDMLEGYRGG